jgi:hypothetical protein
VPQASVFVVMLSAVSSGAFEGGVFLVRQASAQQPAIGHSAPHSPILLVSCGLGHSPAFLCMGTEFLSRKHRTHSFCCSHAGKIRQAIAGSPINGESR